ncbi:MAG: hypothetical protein Q9208_002191, partial [Pyrenodesmia sp. 3 TL-2023]
QDFRRDNRALSLLLTLLFDKISSATTTHLNPRSHKHAICCTSGCAMGFTSGLLSGFTLTASTLYLTILIHTHHRVHQASLLHQQSLLLNSIVDPASLPVEDTAPRYRIERGNWTERWKDGWNKEIEGGVRWAQGVQWAKVREALEGRLRSWRDGERRV